MTPEQLITSIQNHMSKGGPGFVQAADTVSAIQTLIDENKRLSKDVRYYENVLVDLGYLRWM